MVAMEAMMDVEQELLEVRHGLTNMGEYYTAADATTRMYRITDQQRILLRGRVQRLLDAQEEEPPAEPTEAEQTGAFLQAEELTTLREQLRVARAEAELATRRADDLSV